MIRNSLGETRRIYTDLWPVMPDDFGMIATSHRLCKEFDKACRDMELDVCMEADEHDIDEKLRIVIFPPACELSSRPDTGLLSDIKGDAIPSWDDYPAFCFCIRFPNPG